MYGWRARLGVIQPYDNTVIEQEMYKMLPEGISCHSVRSSTTDRYKIAEEGLELAKNLLKLNVNIILYSCFASSFLKGYKFHQELVEKLQHSTNLPVVTPVSSMIDVLNIKGMDNKKLLIITPYPDWINQELYKFLDEVGLNILNIKGARLEPIEANYQTPEDVYRLVKKSDTNEVEAIYICATNFRSIEVLSFLENDLGKTVISTNQSLVYSALKKLNINFNIKGFGSLLER